jgi:hypothetical protein
MPNPYHDETGKFCSGDEMKGAVDRLEQQVAKAPNEAARGQAFDAYFNLRKEYESIKNSVVEVPEEWVGRVANSGLSTLPQTAEGIEAYYRSGFAENLAEGKFHEYGTRVQALLLDEKTPQWIKDEIYAKSSSDIKANLIQKLSTMKGHENVEAGQLLPFVQGSEKDWMVVQSLLSSDRIGFSAKYALAEQTGNLGTLIGRAHDEGELYKNISGIEDKLLIEAEDPNLSSDQRDRALRTIARNTNDPRMISALIDSEEPSSYTLENLAFNRNLTAQEKLSLLDKVGQGDLSHFAQIYEVAVSGHLSDPATGSYAAAVHRYQNSIDSFRPGEASFKAAQQVAETYERGLDEVQAGTHFESSSSLGVVTTDEYFRAQSVLDATPEARSTLEKERKKLEKELRKSGEYSNARLTEVKRRLVRARRYREAIVLTNHLRENTDPRLIDAR